MKQSNEILEFLHQLKQQGIHLSRKEDTLRVEGPKGSLTPELRNSLQRHKPQLLDWFQKEALEADNNPGTVRPNPADLYQPFPLADLQRGFLLAEDPFMEFHVRPHLYMEFDREGLDIDRYRRSWQKALQRHYKEWVQLIDDSRLAVIQETINLPCEIQDLTGYSAAEVESNLLRTRDAMMRAQLPLNEWPWLDLKVSLWQENGHRRARIHYNHNNFFSDGPGTAQLLQEVEQYYQNPDLQLPTIELSTRDAVLALEALAESEAGQRDRHYWESRLPNLLGPPELPTRPGMNRRCRSMLNRREYFLEAPLWQCFKQRANDLGLTPSTAVFAVYAELLGAWANQPHFVLSNMMTRRLLPHPDMGRILGNFASLYPLEVDLRGESTFLERALRLQQQVLRDSQHRRWGGLQVMQQLNSNTGQFGRAPIPFVIGSGLMMEGFERPGFSCLETSQVMLDHQFWELTDGRFYFVWDVMEDSFPDGLLDAMAEGYLTLLHTLATDDPAWQTSRFQLVPESQLDQRQMLTSWQPRPPNRRLEQLPDKAFLSTNPPAVISGLTYAALTAAENRLAHHLMQLGVGPGVQVAVTLARTHRLPVATLGIFKAGGTYVPVAPDLPELARHGLYRSTESRHILSESSLMETLTWPEDAQVIRMEDYLTGGHQVAPPAVRARDTDTAYIIHTSGSTGTPKGVMIQHTAVLNTLDDINQRFKVTADDRILGVSACGFDLSIYDLFGTWAAGATLVYPDPARASEPSHWLDLMQAHRITIWNSAPPLMTLLVEAAELRGQSLPDLRLVMLSGDWIPTDLPDRIRTIAPNSRIVSLGGATEASIWSIVYPITQVEPEWRSIPYGYPMTNQPWYVLDHRGRSVPDYTVGELHIGGLGLAQGYWRDDHKTTERFIAHPETGERLYKTGDLGRYLPGGLIEFLGRADDQVKLNGHRIELGEIETLLAQDETVASAAAAVELNEAERPTSILAFVTPAPNHRPNPERLLRNLLRHLPDYRAPRSIQVVDRLPLTPNGKLDRKALLAGYVETATQSDKSPPFQTAPRTELERHILRLWRTVLDLPEQQGVGVHQSFFDLGGQSYQAIRLISHLNERYRLSLTLADIWGARTIAQLADRVSRGGDGPVDTDALVSLDNSGNGAPLYLVHPAGGQVLCYQSLARQLSRPVYGFQMTETREQLSLTELATAYIERLPTHAPHEPIWLGGWSSGGVIAQEMAVQLQARGHEIGGLVLIDTPPPVVHDPVSEAQLLDWFLEDLNLPEPLRRELSRLDKTGQYLTRVAERLRQRGHSLGDDPGQLQTIYRLFRTIVRASREHKGRPVECRALIVRAERGRVSEFSAHPLAHRPDWGWQSLINGEIHCESLDADHHGLLSEPALSRLVQQINHWTLSRSEH